MPTPSNALTLTLFEQPEFVDAVHCAVEHAWALNEPQTVARNRDTGRFTVDGMVRFRTTGWQPLVTVRVNRSQCLKRGFRIENRVNGPLRAAVLSAVTLAVTYHRVPVCILDQRAKLNHVVASKVPRTERTLARVTPHPASRPAP